MAGAASSKSLPGLERHEGSDAEPRDIPPLLLMAHTTVESTFAQARLALMATAVESAVPRPTARVSTTTTQTTKTAVRLLPICLQSPSHIRPASSAHACLRSGTCITLINYDLNGFTRPSGISQHTEQSSCGGEQLVLLKAHVFWCRSTGQHRRLRREMLQRDLQLRRGDGRILLLCDLMAQALCTVGSHLQTISLTTVA
jgi:hypothetical protein